MLTILLLATICTAFGAARRHDSEQKVLAAATSYVRTAAKTNTLIPEGLTQDMSRPLSHYFISSSHNTYLDAGQLWGTSSVQALGRALSLGVRVIELDVYDSPEGPVCKHGPALTGSFLFMDGIKTIAATSFDSNNQVPSQYPVIITIEDHCSPEGQKQMADILKSELKDLLHVPPTPRPRQYPSPEELKGKVVIRDKPRVMLPVAAEDGSVVEPTAEQQQNAAEPIDEDTEPTQDQIERAKKAKPMKSDDLATGEDPQPAAHGKHGKAMHPDLMALVTIPNVKFKGLDKLHVLGEGSTSSSFSEAKFAKYAKSSAKAFVEYSQGHLARTYPSALRVFSSNYKPTDVWQAGVGIAALNYQFMADESTNQKPVQINQGFFSQNGGAGYVLKPEWMLPGSTSIPDNYDLQGKNAPVVATFGIRVTAVDGIETEDESRIKHLYVKVRVDGCLADKTKWTTDSAKVSETTSHAHADFQKPAKSFGVRRPELTVVTMEVYKDTWTTDKKLNYFSFPLGAAIPGTHSVELWTPESAHDAGATLTFELTKTEA